MVITDHRKIEAELGIVDARSGGVSRRRKISWLAAAALGAFSWLIAMSGDGLAAGQPVAVVEDGTGQMGGLQLFDFVEDGRIIELAAGEKLTIGYFSSCLQETIAGGRVKIGSDRSEVEGGTVSRSEVECDGGRMIVSAADSAVGVARGAKTDMDPQFTLHGASPVVRFDQAARVVIERLDKPGLVFILPVSGKVIDLAKQGLSLPPGGVYRCLAGNASVVFKVSEDAEAGESAVLGRLIQVGG